VPSEKNEKREREREREREKNRERKKKKGMMENLRCRIAARSRASILSFGPVHRNLHGKLPRGRDERNVNE